MTTEKHSIQILAEMAGYKVYPYSGRFTYGSSCLACIPGPNVYAFIADLITEAEGEDTVWQLQEALRCLKTDQMGLGTVVYFPNIGFFEDNSLEEESQDNG